MSWAHLRNSRAGLPPVSIDGAKDVVGFEGLYQVTSDGRVYSTRSRLWLKPAHGNRGYLCVNLLRNRVQSRRTIHSLVCEAFHGPRPAGLHIRHLDGNPLNNHAENLCYGTRSENMLDIVRHGRHWNANKTHCPKGHEYTEENTRRDTRGDSICRRCDGWTGRSGPPRKRVSA